MKSSLRAVAITILVLGNLSCSQEGEVAAPGGADEDLRVKAQALSQELLILDTHIDIPDRLNNTMADISQRTPDGDFDLPRARQGGLNSAFLSIYIPTRYQPGGAKDLADRLIDLVEDLIEKSPAVFGTARSPADVRQHFAEGKISFPLGIENGAPIEGNLENLHHFYDRGVRYITLAHSKSNHLCDSSYDPSRQWGGLSPFGEKVVVEMNRLGIMIDVSHVSDDSFFQVVDLSRAPVIASHSSCRAFTPGWERNMSDEMLQRLKENGGVIQINFGSSFVSADYRRRSQQLRNDIKDQLASRGLAEQDREAKEFIEHHTRQNPVGYADIADVANNIDHAVRLIGIDHVGLGSDFDGLGDTLPYGLKDVSNYPNLIYELLKRGYSEQEIEKICSGNLLRVWSQAEQLAERMEASE